MYELPNVNEIRLSGRLTQDVVIRKTAAGTSVADITVASNPRKKDANGQWIDGTPIFMTAVVWNKRADKLANVKSGTEVLVSGKLSARVYQTKEGQDRRVTEIVADSVIVGAAPKAKAAAPVAAAPKAKASKASAGKI